MPCSRHPARRAPGNARRSRPTPRDRRLYAGAELVARVLPGPRAQSAGSPAMLWSRRPLRVCRSWAVARGRGACAPVVPHGPSAPARCGPRSVVSHALDQPAFARVGQARQLHGARCGGLFPRRQHPVRFDALSGDGRPQPRSCADGRQTARGPGGGQPGACGQQLRPAGQRTRLVARDQGLPEPPLPRGTVRGAAVWAARCGDAENLRGL